MVHGGRGHAVLPAAADSATCSQSVEVIAPSGTSCGTASFSAGTGSCTTKAITIGYDGTVIQQLPATREQQCWFGPCSCSWQWWSGFFNQAVPPPEKARMPSEARPLAYQPGLLANLLDEG